MIEDFMTVKDAAKQLGYTDSAVCHICRQGGFPGVQRLGQKMWLIPAEAVKNYRRGLQGFAAVKARKQQEEAKLMAELKQAVLAVQPNGRELDDVDIGVEEVPVEEAAKMLNMSHRRVRYLCSKGRIAGAHMDNHDWLIPVATLVSIKVYNKGAWKND